VGNLELKVKKKDGRIEDYSREKLERCLEKACGKLNKEEISRMADEIESKLLNWETTEVPSREIGRLVMEKLKGIDPVAYIRFATVFLDIESIEGFNKLLSDFKGEHAKKEKVSD
jgi:transcriptional repressor NrdR